MGLWDLSKRHNYPPTQIIGLRYSIPVIPDLTFWLVCVLILSDIPPRRRCSQNTYGNKKRKSCQLQFLQNTRTDFPFFCCKTLNSLHLLQREFTLCPSLYFMVCRLCVYLFPLNCLAPDLKDWHKRDFPPDTDNREICLLLSITLRLWLAYLQASVFDVAAK